MQQSLIKVIKNSTGRGASHLRVVLEIEGPFKGGMTQPVNTNENGDAFVQHTSSGPANVFVDGKKVGKMKVPGQATFYV
jgi:hypothetical protein